MPRNLKTMAKFIAIYNLRRTRCNTTSNNIPITMPRTTPISMAMITPADINTSLWINNIQKNSDSQMEQTYFSLNGASLIASEKCHYETNWFLWRTFFMFPMWLLREWRHYIQSPMRRQQLSRITKRTFEMDNDGRKQLTSVNHNNSQ